MSLFLPAFGFLPLYSEHLKPTVPCFQESRVWVWAELLTVDFKGHAWEHFHKQPWPQGACWGFGLGLFCFVVFSSSFSRRDVQCFPWIQIHHHSLKCYIAISITLKREKCKVVFPFDLWILRERVSARAVSGPSSYCFGHVALMTFHCTRFSALSRRREALRHREAFVPWAQCHLINLFSGVGFIPSVYVCKY